MSETSKTKETQKKQRTVYTSAIFGVLSIALAGFFPAIGIILSVIGLTIKKDPVRESIDIGLNLVGVLIALLSWKVF